MSITISYENEFNKTITEQQAFLSDSFIKIIKKNNIIKIKEEYDKGRLADVTFYQENESIDEIFIMYPTLSRIEIAKNTESKGIYTKQEFFGYLKNEGLKLHTFNIENSITGQSICKGYYDLQTGNIILERTIKYMYDIYGDLTHYYYYNNMGKIDKVREGNGGDFSNEFPIDYYNNVLPLLP